MGLGHAAPHKNSGWNLDYMIKGMNLFENKSKSRADAVHAARVTGLMRMCGKSFIKEMRSSNI